MDYITELLKSGKLYFGRLRNPAFVAVLTHSQATRYPRITEKLRKLCAQCPARLLPACGIVVRWYRVAARPPSRKQGGCGGAARPPAKKQPLVELVPGLLFCTIEIFFSQPSPRGRSPHLFLSWWFSNRPSAFLKAGGFGGAARPAAKKQTLVFVLLISIDFQ